MLCPFQGGKDPMRFIFQQFCPAFEALGSFHAKPRWILMNICDRLHLVQCLVLHGNLQ